MKERLQNALQDKDFSELFKKGGVSFLMRVGGQIMGFVITFIIAHYFGARGLGDYVLAVIVLRLFVLIAKLGIDTASIRFIAEYATKNHWKSLRKYRRKVSVLLLCSTFLFSVIMYVFAIPIANLVGANPFYIKLNSFFILPMAFFVLNYQSLRGLKKITAFSFFYWMSRITFSAIIILIAVQFSTNEDIPIFAFLLGLIIVTILSFIVFSNSLKQEECKCNSKVDDVGIDLSCKAILLVSLPLLLAQSGQFIMAWTDKLMLGGMMTAHEVGVYDVAFKLSMFVNIALTAVNSISSPKFAEIYAQKDYQRLEKIVHQSTKLIFWTTVPFLIVFFTFSSKLLSLFGDDFSIGLEVFVILCAARMISAFSGPAGNLLQMTGKQIIFMNKLLAWTPVSMFKMIRFLLQM